MKISDQNFQITNQLDLSTERKKERERVKENMYE